MTLGLNDLWIKVKEGHSSWYKSIPHTQFPYFVINNVCSRTYRLATIHTSQSFTDDRRTQHCSTRSQTLCITFNSRAIVAKLHLQMFSWTLMPNTHRRRRRDSTVELSCVGVASAVCIEFATSSRRLPTKIWKLNMLRIYPVQLSRVELCRRCVRARRLTWPSLQFCSQWSRPRSSWVTTGDCCVMAAFTPPTRRNSSYSTSLSANCSDSSRLSSTSCEFNTHSWVASASAVCIGL